jgi:hypothetical protein
MKRAETRDDKICELHFIFQQATTQLSNTTGQLSAQFNNYLLGRIIPNLVGQHTSRRELCEQYCTLHRSLCYRNTDEVL